MPTEINILENLVGPETKVGIVLYFNKFKIIRLILQQVLAAGDAQLLEVDHGGRIWRTVDAGIACFVRDNNSKNRHIQLYSLQVRESVFYDNYYYM